MKTYQVSHTDLVVSRIAYGCAELAGWTREPVSVDDVVKAAEIVGSACDHGITFFDHADLYGFGRAETVFGRVLRQSPELREKLLIQSKCGQVFPEDWAPGRPIGIDVSREHILSAVEGSLKRLGTDRLDILLLHVADSLVQPEEVARAFDELHRTGKVRYFGVSNHNAAQIRLLTKYVRQPLVVNQVRIGLGHPHLLEDGMDFSLCLTKGSGGENAYSAAAGSGTLDYCRENGIQIQAYSPLRGGPLRSAAEPEPTFKGVVQLLSDLAVQKKTSSSAVALAWLLRHPAGIVPIIGSTNPKHITENCEADNVVFTSEEWYRLFAAAVDLKSRLI
jgi:predicted oxidoreductase